MAGFGQYRKNGTKFESEALLLRHPGKNGWIKRIGRLGSFHCIFLKKILVNNSSTHEFFQVLSSAILCNPLHISAAAVLFCAGVSKEGAILEQCPHLNKFLIFLRWLLLKARNAQEAETVLGTIAELNGKGDTFSEDFKALVDQSQETDSFNVSIPVGFAKGQKQIS